MFGLNSALIGSGLETPDAATTCYFTFTASFIISYKTL